MPMNEPSRAYETSVSSVSDLDSMLFSPAVVGFIPVSERPEPFEDIRRPSPQSVNGAPSILRAPPSGMQHPKYYMQENMVVFQVDNILYRLPGYAFVQQSQYFKSLLHIPTRSSSVIAAWATESIEPIYLNDEDVTSVDFERLLSIMFPSEIGEYEATTLEEWTSILHLSMKWGFSSICGIAAQKVFLLASAVDRIVLGRKYGFDSWLLDALVEICERADFLPLPEARRMSFDDYVWISQARETIRLPKAPKDITDVRAVVTQIFGLQDGGSTAGSNSANPGEVQLSTPAMGDSSLSPLTDIDKLGTGDELIIDVSDPVRQIQVRHRCPMNGHSTHITYVPAIKDVECEMCLHSESAEHPHLTKKIEITIPKVVSSALVHVGFGRVRAGVYNTWTTPTLHRITLEPPLAAGTQPTIAIGLSTLDIDGSSHNVRVRATIEQDPGIAHEAFTATLSTWGTTVLHGAGVNWLHVPLERGLQTGRAALSLPSEDLGPKLRDGTDTPVELAHVRFECPYERPPTVVCWLTGLDMSPTYNCRIRTFADHIDGGGFKLSAATWHESELYGAGATWISIPQDAPGVFVGKYSANMERQSGHVAFPRAFRGTPKVVVGLSTLDVDHHHILRVTAFAKDVTPHGFIWEVQTWLDSIINQVEITIIAIESSD